MKVLLILAAVVLLFAVAAESHFAGRRTTVENPSNAIAPVAIPSTLEQTGEDGPELKLVLLALWPKGFESSEMQLDPGEYLFIVGNRTGLKEVNVRVIREGNEHVAAATVGGRRSDWKKRLILTTGTYVVIANDNPDWTCRIVVGR